MPNVLSCDDALTDQRVAVQCENARPVPCRIVNVNSLITTSVTNLAGLAALTTTTAPDGAVVWVQSLRRAFVRDPVLGAPIDGQVVTASGGGSWRSLGSAFTQRAAGWNAVTDWHIDPLAGTVEGTGTALSPISSWLELMSRVNGQQLPATAAVSIHGNLSEVVDLTSLSPHPTTSLLVTGEPGAVVIAAGTVATYTAESLVAPGESPLLTSAAIADWTPYVNARVRFTSGTANGAMTWVSAANPNGLGVNVARVPRPMIPGYPFPSDGTPAVGVSFVVETLPTVTGLVLAGSTARYATILRGITFPQPNGDAGQAIGGGRAVLQGCAIGDAVYTSEYLRFQACRIGTPGGSFSEFRSGMYDYNGCLMTRTYSDRWSGLRINDCVCMGGLLFGGSTGTMAHVGVYNSPSVGLGMNSAGTYVQLTSSGLYGYGNGTYGVSISAPACVLAYSTTRPVITGTTNNFLMSAVAHPWADAPITDTALLSAIVHN